MVELGCDWRMERLSSGLRLITISRPGTPTIAVRATVRAGSRYDVESVPPVASQPLLGLAHLVEHLLFKGTQTRSQRELFGAMEWLGGSLDAGTTKEYTTLHAVGRGQDLPTAMELLAEVLVAPTLREDDFWTEKLVVLEEIRRSQDRQSALLDLFCRVLWQAHPLRHPSLGTLEGLQLLDYESLVAFYRRRYVAGNMVLTVCGDIDHDTAKSQAADCFDALPPGPEQPPALVEEPPLTGPRTAHLAKDLHQAQLLVGVPTVSLHHDDRSALKVLERVLGMGASARLYQRLREEARLVYTIETLAAHYEDAGFLAVHAACDPHNATRVREAILAEWRELCREGVAEEELSHAKGNYAGTLARRFETNLTLSAIFGIEGLLHQVETLEDAVARISAVGRDDVVRVARTYLDGERYVAVSLGREPTA